MKFIKSSFPIIVFLAGSLCAGLASESVAQQLATTNGYVCSPKNPGGEATRLFFRHQDGVAWNIARNATFPIVCPVLVNYIYSSHSFGIRLGNANNFTQKFSCALEENDGGGLPVRSYGRSINIPPAYSNSIIWENIRLSSTNTGNYLGVRCILPPGGYVSTVAWEQ